MYALCRYIAYLDVFGGVMWRAVLVNVGHFSSDFGAARCAEDVNFQWLQQLGGFFSQLTAEEATQKERIQKNTATLRVCPTTSFSRTFLFIWQHGKLCGWWWVLCTARSSQC